jgi:hypothetical protein
MKKCFHLIVAIVLLGLVAPAIPLQAQPTTTIAQLREEVKKTLHLLSSFDNVCVIIVDGFLGEIKYKILEARKLIAVNKGNSGRLLLNVVRDAANLISIVRESYLATSEGGDAYCPAILGADDDTFDDGTIFGGVGFINDEVTAMTGTAPGDMDPRKGFKIQAILATVFSNLTGIGDRLSDIDDSLSEADTILGDFESSCLGSGEEREDQRVIPAQAVPLLGQKGPCTFEELRQFKIDLGEALNWVTQAIRFKLQLVKHKKWVLKGLKEVENLLRSKGFGRARGSEPVALGTLVQIFDLHGQRVYAGRVLPELSRAPLANGLYLIVTSVGGTDPRPQVRKIAVIR